MNGYHFNKSYHVSQAASYQNTNRTISADLNASRLHADHLAPLALLRPAAKELIHAYHAAQFHFTLSLMTIDPNNSDLRDPKV
jgi:hypothetical protein